MPGLSSGNYMLRAAAEREATNAPLQGSAADLMKLAMVRIDRALDECRLDATMLLQIHDELIFEVRKAQFERDGTVWCAATWRARLRIIGPARSNAQVRPQLVRRRAASKESLERV